jgi:hypothetical protein
MARMDLETALSDTDPAAEVQQRLAHARLGPARRVELAAEMCDDVRSVVRDGIRHRHPEYTGDAVHAAFLRIWLGDDLARTLLTDGGRAQP